MAAATRRFHWSRGDPDRGTRRARRSRRSRGAAHPGQSRACLTRPKSCRHHFAAEALL